MKILDPHIHLFDLSKGQYSWLSPDKPPFWDDKKAIYQHFNEDDLTLSNAFELCGFVHIEAGFDNDQPWREIEWLESVVTLPFKSVACINLLDETNDFIAKLNKLSNYQSLVGVRHILDDDAVSLLNSDKVKQNLEVLSKDNFHFEIQMPFDDVIAVDALANIMSIYPQLKFIINHAGLPTKSNFERWHTNLTKISRFPQCAIKCSGWEMIDRDYDVNWIQQVLITCCDTFGENRVMLASNFPLTLFSKNYQQLWSNYTCDLSLTTATLHKLCYDNTRNWYLFKV